MNIAVISIFVGRSPYSNPSKNECKPIANINNIAYPRDTFLSIVI